MRRPALLACLAALPLTVSTASRAQTPAHPPYMPTRDVVVVYDVQPDGAPAPQRITVSFADRGDLMRIDSPDGQGTTILDRDRKLLTVVMNAARVYMEVPERQAMRSPFLLDATMTFVPAGEGNVNGLPCMRWTITEGGGDATACITADGVVLSEEGVDQQGARGKLVARQVRYATIPPATFLPPTGYQRVAHPEGPGPYERGAEGATGPSLGSSAAPVNP